MVVKEYPNLKIGFLTQNFQKAMPMTVESLTELMEYAVKEGYRFIELRDDQATLSAADCKALARVAQKNKLEVIYEIQKNLLDSGYFDVFKRGLANTLFFPKPGILRALLSKSEFETVGGIRHLITNKTTGWVDSLTCKIQSNGYRILA